MNPGFESDPLLRLVADLPQTESDAARVARVRARCHNTINRRTERARKARERADARSGAVTRALYRVWYFWDGSVPDRCVTK